MKYFQQDYLDYIAGRTPAEAVGAPELGGSALT